MGVGCLVWHMQFERRCPETQKIVTLGQKIVLVEPLTRVWCVECGTWPRKDPGSTNIEGGLEESQIHQRRTRTI